MALASRQRHLHRRGVQIRTLAQDGDFEAAHEQLAQRPPLPLVPHARAAHGEADMSAPNDAEAADGERHAAATVAKLHCHRVRCLPHQVQRRGVAVVRARDEALDLPFLCARQRAPCVSRESTVVRVHPYRGSFSLPAHLLIIPRVYRPPVHDLRHEPEQRLLQQTGRLLRNDPVVIPRVRRAQRLSISSQMVVLLRRGRLHAVMTIDLVGLPFPLELGRGLEYLCFRLRQPSTFGSDVAAAVAAARQMLVAS